ncbi:MAG: hypothetical protein V7K27_26635 [Nostoc sp.]
MLISVATRELYNKEILTERSPLKNAIARFMHQRDRWGGASIMQT